LKHSLRLLCAGSEGAEEGRKTLKMAQERSPALWLHTQPSVTRKMPVCHRILLLLWLLHFSSVYSDITDGNAEHLKREHSLIKPYQGE